MKLIIGLGNPGPNFVRTRHNFGFLVCDRLKDTLADQDDWRTNDEFKSLTIETAAEGEKIILVKPQTMMNASGLAAKALADYYKIATPDIWVLHDDIDLPLGILRISQGAGPAGHQGVRSIIESLNTKDFVRIRLGIHPVGQTFFHTFFKKLTSTKQFVLKKFAKSEEPTVEKMIKNAVEAVLFILKEGLEKAKNQFN